MIRRRTTGVASRHASYNRPTSRLESVRPAIAVASASQSARVARAMGTRQRIAAYAPIAPRRTCSCTASGSSTTNASRRDTQLALRPSARATASWLRLKLDASICTNHACSMAVSPSPVRSERANSSASISPSAHTVARTTSCPSRRSARRRRKPSITTYRSGWPGAATTTIGVCCPASASAARSRASRAGQRARRLSYLRSSWCSSRSTLTPARRHNPAGPPKPDTSPLWDAALLPRCRRGSHVDPTASDRLSSFKQVTRSRATTPMLSATWTPISSCTRSQGTAPSSGGIHNGSGRPSTASPRVPRRLCTASAAHACAARASSTRRVR